MDPLHRLLDDFYHNSILEASRALHGAAASADADGRVRVGCFAMAMLLFATAERVDQNQEASYLNELREYVGPLIEAFLESERRPDPDLLVEMVSAYYALPPPSESRGR